MPILARSSSPKIAAAMGAHVVLFTTSPGKVEDAKRLGAAEVVISKDADAMAAHLNSFDFILSTVAAPHDLDPFLALLKRDCTMTLVGAPEHQAADRQKAVDRVVPEATRIKAAKRVGRDAWTVLKPGGRCDATDRPEIARPRKGGAELESNVSCRAAAAW